MDKSGDFQKNIDIVANNLLTVIHSPIKIMAEKSVEGIVSASILLKILLKKNVNFSLSFAKLLDDSIVKEINLDPSKVIFIIGFNADRLKLIDKKVLLISSNEVLFSEVISAKIDLPLPVVSYFLAKQLDSSVDVSHLVLLACNNNKILSEIIKDALESKAILKSLGFRLFGSNTRQFHKVLEYSTDPFILGVSGSEDNSINLIKELGIGSAEDGFSNMMSLDEEDVSRLISTLGIKVDNIKKEEIILLNCEEDNSPLRDINEFSQFLEACIAFDRPSLAVAKCLGSKDFKNRALETLKDYKLEIIKALNMFFTEANNVVSKGENFVMANFRGSISSELLEKVAFLICKNSMPGKRLLLMAYSSSKIKCCMPEYSFDMNSSNLLSKFNINYSKNNGICSFFIEIADENNFIGAALENLEKVKIESINL